LKKLRFNHKLINFFLLFVIFINLAGAPFLFIVLQKKIKREMKRLVLSQVPAELLIPFTLPVNRNLSEAAGFEFIHDKEFRYRGMMFDIIKQEVTGDSVKYLCVNDTNEEALLNAFFAQTHKKKPFDFPSFNAQTNIFVSSGSINEVKCVNVSEILLYYENEPGILPGIKTPPEHPPRLFC